MSEQEALTQFTYQASAAAWPFFAISTVLFGMRTIARTWYNEAPFGWDDLAISVSWLLDVVRMVTFQLALSATRRVDPADLPGTVPSATFWSLFTDAWSFLSVTLPKVGVAFLLVRIFRPRPWVRTTILSIALGLFVFCIAGFVICFVQCSPVAGQWDPYTHPDTVCWPRDVQIDYSLAGSSTSAFLDLAFAIYPGVCIWRLQMPVWKKLITMGLMGLGLASFAFAVIKVSNNATLLGTPTLVELYTNALHIGFWNSIENDFVIAAASLPSIRPLFVACKRYTTTRSSFNSLKPGSRQAPVEEHALEIARHGQPPGQIDHSIHVKHDISLQRELVQSGNHQPPSYNFDV